MRFNRGVNILFHFDRATVKQTAFYSKRTADVETLSLLRPIAATEGVSSCVPMKADGVC